MRTVTGAHLQATVLAGRSRVGSHIRGPVRLHRRAIDDGPDTAEGSGGRVATSGNEHHGGLGVCRPSHGVRKCPIQRVVDPAQ